MKDTTPIHAHIKKLRKRLHQYNQEYYLLDHPSVSDPIYDALYRELEDLERQYPQYKTKNSITQKVGTPILAKFAPV